MSQHDWRKSLGAASDASEQPDPGHPVVTAEPVADADPDDTGQAGAGQAGAGQAGAGQAGAGQAGAGQAAEVTGSVAEAGHNAEASADTEPPTDVSQRAEAGRATEPGPPDAGQSADAPQSAEPGAPAEAGQPADDGQSSADPLSAQVDQRANATSRDQGFSGWSGRAIGPLSSLLPGGAVDLTADEMPVEHPTSAGAAGGHESASAAAGAEGEQAVIDVPAGNRNPRPGDSEQSSPVAADDRQPTLPAEAGDRASADRAAAEDDDAPAAVASDDAQPDEADQAAPATEPGPTGSDDRWHAALVGFVDDPRGSVEAARALIDEDMAAHLALLARRTEVMHAAWQANKDVDTEALRVALVKYRDLRRRLADVAAALNA